MNRARDTRYLSLREREKIEMTEYRSRSIYTIQVFVSSRFGQVERRKSASSYLPNDPSLSSVLPDVILQVSEGSNERKKNAHECCFCRFFSLLFRLSSNMLCVESGPFAADTIVCTCHRAHLRPTHTRACCSIRRMNE